MLSKIFVLKFEADAVHWTVKFIMNMYRTFKLIQGTCFM